MNLIITLIGNAVVDYNFRHALREDPDGTMSEWGFRLTKGEYQMFKAVFAHYDDQLETAFKNLEDQLYDKLAQFRVLMPCQRPCDWSLIPPGETVETPVQS